MVTAAELERMVLAFENKQHIESRALEIAKRYNYAICRPSYYSSEAQFLTPGFLNDLLTSQKTILSVGAGPAFLEQFLAYAGVDRKRIALADFRLFQELPREFKRLRFDARRDWPDLGERFDYILFPESFGVMTLIYPTKNTANWNDIRHARMRRRGIRILQNALRSLADDGIIRIQYFGFEGSDFEDMRRAAAQCAVIENSGVQYVTVRHAQNPCSASIASADAPGHGAISPSPIL